MQIIELIQGSPEWHAHRAKHFNASDAAAMMGADKNGNTRTALLQFYAIGREKEVSDYVQKNVFDKGHEAEAAARPIVEERLGESLYPVTGTETVDGLNLSASFDGITMLHDTIWENKLLNGDLAEIVLDESRGGLEPHYYWQLEHQLLVSGAEKAYFTTSDGTEESTYGTFYYSVPERRAKLIAGWKQFDEDLRNYQHVEVAERPAPEVQIELPALFIQAQGAITASNMEEYGKALAAKLAEVRAIKLVTDQDFSNAKEAAKVFREQCKKLELAKQAMLAQTVTIGEAARMMDAWHEDLRQTALQLEKDVEREDLAKKRTMISEAGLALSAHIQALESETSPIQLNLQRPDFAGAIKNKRNYASMQDALDTALANAKIEADAAARDIRQKLEWFNATDSAYKLLFPDLQDIIQKPAEDFRLTVDSRINEHKQAEEKRLNAERERIRKEEEAKAQSAARESVKPPENPQLTPAEQQAALDKNEPPLEFNRIPTQGEAGTPAGPGTSTPASEGGYLPASPTYAVRKQHTSDIKAEIEKFFAKVGTPKAKQANYRAVIMAWEEFKAGADMEQAA